MGDAQAGDAALIRGLRLPRHEAQLTQVIGQVAMADRRFAADFARVVLGAAAENPRYASEVASVLDVPDELDCIAEHHLPGQGRDDRGLGFVDLAFQGEPGFTLFVENKLHSGYGHDQVKRYLDALDQLPEYRRSGLVAVTRNYPSYGEDEAVGRKGWLGSVRWRALLPGLRKLKPVNQQVARQWRARRARRTGGPGSDRSQDRPHRGLGSLHSTAANTSRTSSATCASTLSTSSLASSSASIAAPPRRW